MLHRVADEMFWVEDPGGLPVGLVTVQGDGSVSPGTAEIWLSASPCFRLPGWVASDAGRGWLASLDEQNRPGGD